MGNYVTVFDIRSEGVVASDYSDALVSRRIAKWEALVEKLTNNVFRVFSPGELVFDGSNTRLLHFNIPLVEVTSVKVNGSSVALDPIEYRAFTGNAQPRDDRGNPKIEMLGCRSDSAYNLATGLFVKGLDQLIDATWGYVDPDPSTPGSYLTPQPIIDAIIALVIRDLTGYFDHYFNGNIPPSLAPVQRERTDGHEIEYAGMSASTGGSWGMIPEDIRSVLFAYRSPLKVRTPEVLRFVPYDLTFETVG